MTTLVVVVVILCVGAVVTFIGGRLIARAFPPHGRFVVVGGMRQHVLELGQGAPGALPVVLIHGAGANLEDMRLALGDLLAARHRVVLIDRPGFGWSEREGREGNSPAHQAAVLRDVLDQLGVDRGIIVGHSWGGTLALAFALAYPQRVAGLVLVAPPTHPSMPALTWLNAILATPVGWLFAYTLAFPFGALLLAPGVRTVFLPQTPPPHYLRRTAAWLVLRPTNLLANWADVAGLEPFLAQQFEHYGTLTVPAIAFTGDGDFLVPSPQHGGKLATATECVQNVILPGYGHMLHHAAADRVIAAVEEIAAKYASEEQSPDAH